MHWLRIDRYSSKVPFEGDNQKAEILQWFIIYFNEMELEITRFFSTSNVSAL
jgi:hypothetical protein